MKKSRVIEIFRFLNTIKLNKVSNKEMRSAIISNHMQMHNIAKQYDEDVKELQKKLFEGKEENIESLNSLREEYKKANDSRKKEIETNIIKDHSDILSLEMEFNNEIVNLLNSEVELNLKKVTQDIFIDSCVEADVDITSGDLIILTDLFE